MRVRRQHWGMGIGAVVAYGVGAYLLYYASIEWLRVAWIVFGLIPCLLLAVGFRYQWPRMRGIRLSPKKWGHGESPGKIGWEDKCDSEAIWQSGQYDYQRDDFRLLIKYDVVQRLVRDLVDGPLIALDVGAGHGSVYPLLKDRLACYHYVDISPTALDMFNKLHAPDERVVAEVSDFENITLSRQYNVILFLGFLHTHYSVAQFRNMLSRHWREDGLLIMEMTKGYSKSFPLSQYIAQEPLCRIEYTASYPGSDWKWERMFFVFQNGKSA